MSKVVVAKRQNTAHNPLVLFGNEPFICPEWAVCYGHAQDHGKFQEVMSCLANWHTDKGVEDLKNRLREQFPVQYAENQVACGEWFSELPAA